MIRWGVTLEEFANAAPVRRWTRGEELGLMMTAEEYRRHLEYPREPEYNPDTGEELEEGCYMIGCRDPENSSLCDPITGCPGCAQERRRRESRDGCK